MFLNESCNDSLNSIEFQYDYIIAISKEKTSDHSVNIKTYIMRVLEERVNKDFVINLRVSLKSPKHNNELYSFVNDFLKQIWENGKVF